MKKSQQIKKIPYALFQSDDKYIYNIFTARSLKAIPTEDIDKPFSFAVDDAKNQKTTSPLPVLSYEEDELRWGIEQLRKIRAAIFEVLQNTLQGSTIDLMMNYFYIDMSFKAIAHVEWFTRYFSGDTPLFKRMVCGEIICAASQIFYFRCSETEVVRWLATESPTKKFIYYSDKDPLKKRIEEEVPLLLRGMIATLGIKKENQPDDSPPMIKPLSSRPCYDHTN